jgi:hypothetical protein
MGALFFVHVLLLSSWVVTMNAHGLQPSAAGKAGDEKRVANPAQLVVEARRWLSGFKRGRCGRPAGIAAIVPAVGAGGIHHGDAAGFDRGYRLVVRAIA